MSPVEYRELATRGREFIGSLPDGHIGKRVFLLDNWNEWGEGHHIAPHGQYGFGFLDVIRDVFTEEPKEHVDVVPADLGMGPYDTRFKSSPKDYVFTSLPL